MNDNEFNKRYRILMVTGIYPTQALPHKGTFIKTLVDSLVVQGHEVEVIHPKQGPVIMRYLSAAWQVFWKTLTGRFDIVHGHYGLWCLVARLQWTTPVVAAYLGDDLLGTVTFDGRYTRKSLLVTRISRWLCRHVEAVTVKSEQMKKMSLWQDAVVIPDGVDFALFHPIPRAEARTMLGWDQDRNYIVFANNPAIAVKNFTLAQTALARLQERGIAAELIVANGLAQQQVVQYINACNALILPSIAEGSPNVVKEAMACNIPVVATAVGDVGKLLAHTAGCSICSHNADALATGLERALAFQKRTTGREDIRHLDMMHVVGQVVALYQQAIQGKAEKRVNPLLQARQLLPDWRFTHGTRSQKSINAGRKSLGAD
jgi:glycosyltransferase involved in cell wall biosynthesis